MRFMVGNYVILTLEISENQLKKENLKNDTRGLLENLMMARKAQAPLLEDSSALVVRSFATPLLSYSLASSCARFARAARIVWWGYLLVEII